MDELDETEVKRLKLLTGTVAVIVIVLSVVAVLIVRLAGDSDEKIETYSLSEEDRVAALAFSEKFLTTSGNFGLTESAFSEVRSAFLSSAGDANDDFMPRYVVTDDLAANYFSSAAEYTAYNSSQRFAGTPYRVTTEWKEFEVPAEGLITNGKEGVRFNVDLTSKLSYYGRTQGYLLEDGTPAPVATYRTILTYNDTATITLVKDAGGDWRVSEVQGLDKIRILAFQDLIGFHDDIVIGLPNPSSTERVEVEGAPTL